MKKLKEIRICDVCLTSDRKEERQAYKKCAKCGCDLCNSCAEPIHIPTNSGYEKKTYYMDWGCKKKLRAEFEEVLKNES